MVAPVRPRAGPDPQRGLRPGRPLRRPPVGVPSPHAPVVVPHL